MSYALGLHFKKVKDASEALSLMAAVRAEELKTENILEKINLNLYYVQQLYNECKRLKLINESGYSNTTIFDYVLQGLFTNRFYYWEEYQLVGFLYMEEKLPTYLKKYFDGFIYFQNSTDQDYDYSWWKPINFIAEPIIKKVEAMSLADIEKQKGIECSADQLDYYKRTLVYDLIEKALDIDSAIWISENKVSTKFKYFCETLPLVTDYPQISTFIEETLLHLFKKEIE